MALIQTLEQALEEHAFTQGLTVKQVATLANLATEVSFEENDVIFVDGQHSTSFYLLLTGSVVVELRTPVCVMVVQALEPGNVFGWSALLDRQDTLFQVRAREHTTALQMDGAALKARCLSDTALGVELLYRLLYVLTARVKTTELRYAEMCGIKMCQECALDRGPDR